MHRTATDQENQLIEQGINAEELINSPTFIAVLNALSNSYISELLNTKPNQSQEREGLYNLTKATQGIVTTLNEWIAVKDQIAQSLEAQYEDNE